MYEIDISICIEKDWISYEYNSFARGYHAYMNIWNPLVEETLKWRQEPSNEVDKNAVAIRRSDSWEKETIVRHVPQNIFKTWSMFLKVSNNSIEVQVVEKRLNRGGATVLKSHSFIVFMAKKTCLIKKISWLKLVD